MRDDTAAELAWGLGLTAAAVALAASRAGSAPASGALPSGALGLGDGPAVVISTYAGGLSWWPGAQPRLLEWPGVVPAPGKHPSWLPAAQALRGSDGRLIPNLLAKYKMADARRVAVIGFSAGSNSGLTQLLEHPLDRLMVDFVGSFDGIHVPEAPAKPGVPLSLFAYPNQVAHWLDVMRAAALGVKGAVFTASNVAAPLAGYTKTRTALTALLQATAMSLGRLTAGDTPWTSPPLLFRPGDAPLPTSTLDQVRALWGTTAVATLGQLRALAAPNGDQANDHVKQATAIGPLLRATLVERWRASGTV